MPANPKLSATPWPPATSISIPKTTTPPFLGVGGCDDDDDLQCPPHASRVRPLKPSNVPASRRLRKNLKLPPSYSAKENNPVGGVMAPSERVVAMAAAAAETLAVRSSATAGVPKDNEAENEGNCGILECRSDDSKLSANGKKGLGGYGECSSAESRVLEPDATCNLGGGHFEGTEGDGSRACTAVSDGGVEVGRPEFGPSSTEKERIVSGPSEGHHCSRTIELGRSGSTAKCKFVGVGLKEAEELDSSSQVSAFDEGNVDTEAGVSSRSVPRKNERSGFEGRNGNYHVTSVESEFVVPQTKHDFGVADCKEFQEPGLVFCSMVSKASNVVVEDVAGLKLETTDKKSSISGDLNASHCSHSVESVLPESQRLHCFEADDCDTFEIGTQLNELINLCMEDGVGGHPNSKASPVEGMDSGRFESVYKVQCPLCGSDISDLSEELQLAHTNNCLDEDEPAKESNSNHEREPFGGENIENKCVLEWLRNLGLPKYEELFIREEVDWETLQWLTEEDLLGMGISSLGPRKKIIHALGELRNKNDHANDSESDVLISENIKKAKLSGNGNKLITEFFRCSSDEKQRDNQVKKPSKLNSHRNPSAKLATSRSCARKAKVKETPLWCCIPGTPFRVDAFRYLRGDCCHWFLTHFHLDHYQGLTRSFCHGKIYCSSITASLVHHKIGIAWDRLHVLPLNKRITVAGVNLTCFDANHCPGSIILLFESPNGKAILHTGDFRFSPEMASNPILQSSHIHTLILDTTYCNPRYDFPSQEIVIQFVIEAIQAESFNPKTLFLIGSYTIGKERLFTEVARLLQKKVYVGAAKLQILKHLELPQEIMPWLTANEAESHIHVVPMWTLASFKRMKHLSTQYADRYDLIVAFCPTGWAFGKGRKKTPGRRWQQGTIIRYEVPYSEHSSFTELREFVRLISPEHIIPSVNNDGPESTDAMLAQLLND